MQDVEMDDFLLDLEEAEELPMQESPWYIAVGGKAILIVTVAK